MALWKPEDNQAAKPIYIKVGQVETVTITAGGSGYLQGDTVTFSAAPAGGVTATGTATVTGGVITAITITNPGAGYVTAPTITIGTVGGTLATFSVAIAPIVYDNDKVVFVSLEEAQNPTNKIKGLKAPGWWIANEYTDADGTVRYKPEHLIAVTATQAAAGDADDDLIVPDVETTIAISVQPANQTTITGAATFAVTAAFSAGSGTLLYQWQVKPAGATRYASVDGANSASLVLAAQTSANTGDMYRVVVSGAGAKAVTSTAATLTFGT
jgi:hypothetical protein